MAKIPQVTRPSPIIQSLQVCLDADRMIFLVTISFSCRLNYLYFLNVCLILIYMQKKIHCSIFIREVLKLPEVVGIDFVNHTGIYNTLICAICICENLKTLNYLE